MLNYIWGLMIVIGIIVAALTGKIPELTDQILDSAKEAISLLIVMLGVVSMWNGVMKIAEESGLVEGITKKISPIIKFLYPKLPEESKAKKYIAANMVANFLGLGWASTPTGLMAFQELDKLNNNSKIASHEMCTFLIINISSLQLIPINMIAYRSQYGSLNPTGIILPGIIATVFSTIVGVAFAKVMSRRKL